MSEGDEDPHYPNYVYERIQQGSPEGGKLSYRVSLVGIYSVLKI